MARSAVVVGAGIGGLSAAIALQQAGYEVRVFERAAVLEPLGAALSVWGNAMAALDDWGCGAALRAGAAQVRGVTLSRTDGRVLVGPVDLSATDSWLPTRAMLQAVLLENAGRGIVTCGVDVTGIEDRGDQVILRSADGEIARADMAVMADGIWSQFGTQLAGPAAYAGYGGAIGLGAEDTDRATGVDALPDGHGEEIWGSRERFGVFNAGGGRPYWFYMASMDADAVPHRRRDAILARSEAFPERIRQALEATPESAITRVAIHAKPPAKSLGKWRILCIGDAAHPMEPNMGQGACQAIEDAYALGRIAARVAPEAILPALEQARLKRAGRYVRESAMMGRGAHSPRRWERGLVQGALSLAPGRLDQYQTVSRLEAVSY